jgi:dynactin complex subunit
MSNAARPVIRGKHYIKDIQSLREALNQSSDKLREANNNLANIEKDYIKYKREVKEITENNLFLALFSAFRLWKGERR